MRKIIFLYGSISGAIVIGSMILGLALSSGGEEQMAALEWVGYLIMLVALSVIFIGIKKYRDQELGGVIRFTTAFALGLGISAVAGAIYVVAWEANLALTDYAFIDDYTAAVIEGKKADGVSGAELEAVEAEMEKMTANYAKPHYRLPITFLEIFPVGLLISLISALILRNEKILPAAPAAAAVASTPSA